VPSDRAAVQKLTAARPSTHPTGRRLELVLVAKPMRDRRRHTDDHRRVLVSADRSVRVIHSNRDTWTVSQNLTQLVITAVIGRGLAGVQRLRALGPGARSAQRASVQVTSREHWSVEPIVTVSCQVTPRSDAVVYSG
jgi:hypothetical protein